MSMKINNLDNITIRSKQDFSVMYRVSQSLFGNFTFKEDKQYSFIKIVYHPLCIEYVYCISDSDTIRFGNTNGCSLSETDFFSKFYTKKEERQFKLKLVIEINNV